LTIPRTKKRYYVERKRLNYKTWSWKAIRIGGNRTIGIPPECGRKDKRKGADLRNEKYEDVTYSSMAAGEEGHGGRTTDKKRGKKQERKNE